MIIPPLFLYSRISFSLSLLTLRASLELWGRCSLFFRAGELSADEIEKIVTILTHPRQFKIPDWFLNRRKDPRDGKFSQVIANNLDVKLRDDLEALKKIRYGLSYFFIACCIYFPPKMQPWSPPLLGYPCAWTTHKDHWSQRTHSWCLQEEGSLIVL